MDIGVKGRKVVITGGSKGIGLACAEAFAAEGANIVLASRDQARLDAAAAAVRNAHGVTVQTVAADLALPEARAALAAAHDDADILINNAGAIPGGSILDMEMETWAAAWQLKVFGYIHMTQLFLRAMKERQAGTIINIIGMAARVPRWDYVCGATGNAGLNAFTNAVGGKATDFGVRVFGINPSLTRTDRVLTLSRAKAQTRFGDPERWEETFGPMPFGRIAEPSEVAALAAMLAAPQVAYFSGTVIDLDGGGQYRDA